MSNRLQETLHRALSSSLARREFESTVWRERLRQLLETLLSTAPLADSARRMVNQAIHELTDEQKSIDGGFSAFVDAVHSSGFQVGLYLAPNAEHAAAAAQPASLEALLESANTPRTVF